MHDHSTFNNPGPAGANDHLTTAEVAARMLYAGVTNFVDLFADEKKIFEARQALRSANAARLFAAGPMFTCSGGHGTEFGFPTRVMDNPSEARTQVDQLAKRKPDFIKIAYDHARDYPSMNQATMAAVVAQAKKRGIRTVVHIGTWKDAREAVEAGATIVTHLHETDIPPDLVTLMKKKGTWEIPTMTYQTDLLHIIEDRSILSSPLLKDLISPALMEAYRRIDVNDEYVAHVLKMQTAGRNSYPRSLKKLADAGVRMMIGTDSGDLGVFHGFSVHREMAIWVKSGVSVWQALAAATTLPKKFLHRPLGTAKGDLADLVVLGGSPISDISNTQDISMVFHDGKLVDRPALLGLRNVSSAKAK
jgi:imidazolonepropionase-like amidohydrolase